MEGTKSSVSPGLIPSQSLSNSHGPEVVASEHFSQNAPQMQPGNLPEVVQLGDLPEVVSTCGKRPASGKSDYMIDFRKFKQRKKMVFGVSVCWWMIIGGLVLVGAGVGLGVGLGIRSNTSDASPNSTTPSSTTSTDPTTASSPSPLPVTSGTTGIAAYNCTSTTTVQYQTSDGTNFTEHCGVDWTNGTKAADGNGTVQDINQVLVYTFESCVANCVAWNWNAASTHSDNLCNAVTYNANLTLSYPKHKANCWLKNKQGVDRVEIGVPIASAAMAPK